MRNTKISVLLLNPPYKEAIIRDNYCCFTSKSGYLWPPVDLLYLSGILKDSRIKLKVIDAVVLRWSWGKVFEAVKKNDFDVAICLTGTASFREDLEGLKVIKKNVNTKIYLLGNTPTFKPERLLRNYPFVDGIFHNFFDQRLLQFILEEEINLESVSLRKANGSLKIGKINYLPPLSEIKIGKTPQYKLFPIDKYSTPIAKKKPLVTVLASFGCPLACKFCVASALSFYPRNIRDLEKEFNEIRKHQIKEIFFEDSTFNAKRSHSEKICRLLIKKKYGFSWSANIYSFDVTLDNLTLMKKAGCHTVQIGVESGNQETLNEFAPSKRIEKLKEVFKLCQKVGIKTLAYFIIGFPNETPQMAEKTIDLAKDLNPEFASFSILTPDYGTKLYKKAVEKRLIKDDLLSFDPSGAPILKNKKFPKNAQERMVKKAYRKFYGRPRKLLSYLIEYNKVTSYLANGLRLFLKKFL